MPWWLTWTVMMTLLGFGMSAAVYVWTGSWLRTLAGLLGSGIVANSIASGRAGTHGGGTSRT